MGCATKGTVFARFGPDGIAPSAELIDAAERAGNTRLADDHRQVHANLDRVITALEVIEHEELPDAAG